MWRAWERGTGILGMRALTEPSWKSDGGVAGVGAAGGEGVGPENESRMAARPRPPSCCVRRGACGRTVPPAGAAQTSCDRPHGEPG